MALRLGIGMIIAALVAPLTILVVPFFGVMGSQLTAYATMIAICAEVMFWGGIALMGRDTWRAIRDHGWRRTPRRILEVVRAG
ncbi:MAG: transporter suffix domain-containing protein [Solirubrobacterales bacterium]